LTENDSLFIYNCGPLTAPASVMRFKTQKWYSVPHQANVHLKCTLIHHNVKLPYINFYNHTPRRARIVSVRQTPSHLTNQLF